MRKGYTPELAERLERHPTGAHPILEVVKTVARDIIDTKTDWNGADSTTGFFVYKEGGIRLVGSTATHTEHAPMTPGAGADITALVPPLSDTLDCAVIEWAGSEIEAWEIHSVTAKLDPDTGGGKEVVDWVCRLFRLFRIEATGSDLEPLWSIEPITDAIQVTAGGSATDVTFVVNDGHGVVRPGNAPAIDSNVVVTASTPTTPTTIMIVWALKGGGVAASNAAWLCDSDDSEVEDNGHTINRRVLTKPANAEEEGGGTQFIDDGKSTGVPILAIKGKTFTEATIEFTSDPLDLGSCGPEIAL